MSHLCCQTCRLRFSPLAAAFITICPECGAPPTSADGPASLVGFRLLDPGQVLPGLPEAIAVSLPVPRSGAARAPELDR